MGGSKGNELDIYLSESILEENETFDILKWWKFNSKRFPILSKMARDVFIVPISIVASESAFSISCHVIDALRSSLTPKIVEALIFTQDWLRASNKELSIKETIDDLKNIEKGIYIT